MKKIKEIINYGFKNNYFLIIIGIFVSATIGATIVMILPSDILFQSLTAHLFTIIKLSLYVMKAINPSLQI